MKRISLLIILNVRLSLIIAQTPITLGNANMPGGGDTLRFTNFVISTAGNYTQTGTNRHWDFSNVSSTTEGLRTFKNSLLTPYAFSFLGLNEYGEKVSDTLGAGPLMLTDYYNFYKKQSSPPAFIADGVGMTFSSVPIPSYYSDKDELYHFPMTYPKYDSSTFKFSTTTAGIIPVKYTKVGYRITVVDGWGTVTTPYGTQSCLRLVTTQYAVDSIKNTFVPIPLGFPNYQRSYQWLTSNSKIPYVEISGSLVGAAFTPTQARYRGYKSENPTGLTEYKGKAVTRLYPNPVKGRLYVECGTGGVACYRIYTSGGEMVDAGKMPETSGDRGVDVSALKAGVYFIQLGGEKYAQPLKFIKE